MHIGSGEEDGPQGWRPAWKAQLLLSSAVLLQGVYAQPLTIGLASFLRAPCSASTTQVNLSLSSEAALLEYGSGGTSEQRTISSLCLEGEKLFVATEVGLKK